MKRSAIPTVLLVVLCLAFAGYLSWSADRLPQRVATHFGLHGQPDRWTDRPSAIMLMAGFGLGLPLLMAALSFIPRFMPSASINIPNREYWLAPERRETTYAFFSCQFLWLACLLVCFMAAVHWLTIEANMSTPVRMQTRHLLPVMGGFLAGMGVWLAAFILHFRRPRSG